MKADTWKWLKETPLGPAWRRRLELCLGVVASGAAVVALSASFKPDPAMVAALHGIAPLASRPVDPIASRTPEKPELSTELLSAARAGDARAMATAYRPGMPLGGTLASAVRTGKLDAVRWLLDHGATVHDEEDKPFGPLISADPYPEITALLRARGAVDPTIELAAYANAPNMMLRLLAMTPRPPIGDALRGMTSMSSSKPEVRTLIVRKLLEAGADANEGALSGAVERCDDVTPEGGRNPECMAVVDLLLGHGAHVTGDALGAALSLGDGTRAAPLDALLALPLEPGVTSAALARATSVSKSDLARIVARGVDWAWHDGEDDQELPVLAAARRGDRDYVQALLDAGAPVDARFKDGSCALTEALDGAANNPGHARIVELLVTRGANVNRRLPDGRTPLFAAAEGGDMRVVTFLLAHGARPNDRVLDDTALDAARQHDNTTAARILHASGAQSAHASWDR